MKTLKPRHLQALRFVQTYPQTHGYPPIGQEVRAHLGINYGNTWRLLHLLQRNGLLTWVPNIKRTLQLTDAGKKAIGVPTVRYAVLRENPRRWHWLPSAQNCADLKEAV